MFFGKIFTQRPWAAPFSLERSELHEPTNPIPKRATIGSLGAQTQRQSSSKVGLRSVTYMMVCVPDGGSPKCASTPANVCDAQPEGDPECVWPCPGYYDAHGDPVEEPTLCLPGEMCIDGAFCG